MEAIVILLIVFIYFASAILLIVAPIDRDNGVNLPNPAVKRDAPPRSAAPRPLPLR